MTFLRRKSVWLINNFYVIGHESYRIRRNNANYTAIMPFKVTDFGTNRKPTSNFLLVINTNLPYILHRFRLMADYTCMSNFR